MHFVRCVRVRGRRQHANGRCRAGARQRLETTCTSTSTTIAELLARDFQPSATASGSSSGAAAVKRPATCYESRSSVLPHVGSCRLVAALWVARPPVGRGSCLIGRSAVRGPSLHTARPPLGDWITWRRLETTSPPLKASLLVHLSTPPRFKRGAPPRRRVGAFV